MRTRPPGDRSLASQGTGDRAATHAAMGRASIPRGPGRRDADGAPSSTSDGVNNGLDGSSAASRQSDPLALSGADGMGYESSRVGANGEVP
jgi:hypothetical protein